MFSEYFPYFWDIVALKNGPVEIDWDWLQILRGEIYECFLSGLERLALRGLAKNHALFEYVA